MNQYMLINQVLYKNHADRINEEGWQHVARTTMGPELASYLVGSSIVWRPFYRARQLVGAMQFITNVKRMNVVLKSAGRPEIDDSKVRGKIAESLDGLINGS